MLTHTIQSTISSLITICIAAFTTNILVGLVIIIGIIILFRIKKYFDKEKDEYDRRIYTKITETDISIANQFTNRIDTLYTPSYMNLFDSNKFNPVIGLTESCQVWDKRNLMSMYSRFMIDIIRTIIIFSLLLYLWYHDNITLIIFVVSNMNRLFSFLDIISYLEQIKGISGGRLSATFAMMDELYVEELYVDTKIRKNSIIDIINRFLTKPINKPILKKPQKIIQKTLYKIFKYTIFIKKLVIHYV